jgi:hypothetical protein
MPLPMPGCLESSEERPSNFDCNRKGWMPNPARQLCGEFCFYRARRFAVALAVTLFDRTGLRGGGLSRSTAERFLDRCSQPNHQSTRPRPGPQFQAMDTAPEPAAARAVPPALERSRPIAGTAAFVHNMCLHQFSGNSRNNTTCECLDCWVKPPAIARPSVIVLLPCSSYLRGVPPHRIRRSMDARNPSPLP